MPKSQDICARNLEQLLGYYNSLRFSKIGVNAEGLRTSWVIGLEPLFKEPVMEPN